MKTIGTFVLIGVGVYLFFRMVNFVCNTEVEKAKKRRLRRIWSKKCIAWEKRDEDTQKEYWDYMSRGACFLEIIELDYGGVFVMMVSAFKRELIRELIERGFRRLEEEVKNLPTGYLLFTPPGMSGFIIENSSIILAQQLHFGHYFIRLEEETE